MERLKDPMDKIDEVKGFPTPAALFGFLKKILHEHEIPFTVAPYSALAQVRSEAVIRSS